VSCFLLATVVFVQSERGSITGTVTDSAHALIPHAAVLAKNSETGIQYQSVTTQTGDYTHDHLLGEESLFSFGRSDCSPRPLEGPVAI
jgi:Carboxypeptidase regulatory-like domain